MNHAMLQREGLGAEPGSDFRRKERRQCTVNPLIVAVQPCKCLRAEEFRDDCRCIEMAEGKGLEVEPVTELGYAGFAAEDDVLVTHAVHSFAVEGRFVGSNHAREERLRVILIAD